MKNKLFTIFIGAVISAVLFNACDNKEKPLKKYDYPGKKEVLSFCIEKTEYYDDRIEVTFSEDSIEMAESVICYDENFNQITETVDFTVKDDVLTIYSKTSEKISALRVDIDSDEYFNIRYLDSDSYAMLQYNWADDYGMKASGDIDSFYTEEEKRRQAEIAAQNIKKNNEAFALIEGIWESRDGSKRLEIGKKSTEDKEYKNIDFYDYQKDEIYPTESVRADSLNVIDSDTEPVIVEVIEIDHLDHLTEFRLYSNMTEIECSLSDERMYKKS